MNTVVVRSDSESTFLHKYLLDTWPPWEKKWKHFLPKFLCVLNPFSHVGLFEVPWTIARQAPLSMGFSRQDYWSELPFPSPGDLPNLGIEHMSLMSPALIGGFLYH